MDTISQAGAIVFRTDGPTPRVLLVRSRKNPSDWVFPKGHVEPGESHAATALREADEEAGVTGILVGRLQPALTFRSGAHLIRVEYYLVQLSSEGPSPERRDKHWLSLDEALQRLVFPDARQLLVATWPDIERRWAMDARP